MTTKWLAALSGLVMVGWLVLHVLGNLTALSGAAAMDGYAAGLRRLGPLLWAARVGLAAALLVHLTATISLARRARAGRPVRRERRFSSGSLASRTMVIGGPALALFLVYHLLHLTWGAVHPRFLPGHVYANLVTGLAPPLVAGLYVLAAALVGLHLHHGIEGALVSFGAAWATAGRARLALRALAVAIAAGFALVPLAVLAGVVR